VVRKFDLLRSESSNRLQLYTPIPLLSLDESSSHPIGGLYRSFISSDTTMAPREMEPLLASTASNHSLNSLQVAPCTFTGECSPLLEACRHLLLPNGSIIGRDVAETVLPVFPTVVSAIPTTQPSASDQPRVALQSIDGRTGITHARIVQAIDAAGATLHAQGFGRGSRIALVLPNGPELALAILCVAQWAACVPLSATGALQELEADLQRCDADLVIGLLEPAHRAIADCAAQLRIPFLGLVPSATEAGVFTLQVPTPGILGETVAATTVRRRKDTEPNGAGDEILVLFTSGTTGNKKLVPHLQGDIITAAATIALSWNLTPADINLNMMPLFHGT
jgi:AMP-binding enzyme